MDPSSTPRPLGKVTVIKPIHGWKAVNLAELWRYRELLVAFCVRDIKVRYKQTVLGATWAILQPLTTMVIFTIIFGGLAKIPSEGYAYPVFVYAALLPWTLFSTVVSTSAGSLVGASHMVSKVYFPRLVVPLSSAGSAIVDFFISSIILMLLMVYYGVGFSWQILMVPFLLVGVLLTSLGIGTLISALTVSYRDFRYVVPFMVQIWMYVTPVVYPLNFIPERWQWLLFLNPMSGYVDGFRAAFLGKPIDSASLSYAVVITILLFVFGVKYFRKVEQRFADII